ncbi:MAG TPA: TIM barrel protein, partial [Agriterribacter sp.]|nr:TIM barrel protein [Agriterribacter sp.]
MTNIQGPAIFLAQFLGDQPPFNNLKSICEWAAGLGYTGVQLPTWDSRIIDLQKAAESKTYADEIKGIVNGAGLQITELSSHLQGQLVAVHPAYNDLFDGFAPQAYHGNPKARTEWAVQQLKYAAKASQNLGLKAHATFSGALLWQTVYPWPQRPAGLVETGFTELANR